MQNRRTSWILFVGTVVVGVLAAMAHYGVGQLQWAVVAALAVLGTMTLVTMDT